MQKNIHHKIEGIFLNIQDNALIGIDPVKTGQRMKMLCQERGCTVRQIHHHLGVAKQSAYAWFEGRTLPSLDNIYQLSKFLDVSIDQMIVGKETDASFYIKIEKTEEKRSGIIVLKYITKAVLK